MLMDFLADTNTTSAVDVVFFVREIAQCYPALRHQILEKLLFLLSQIRSSRVARSALWILGQYSDTADLVYSALDAVFAAIGPTPFVKEVTEESAEGSTEQGETRTIVLEDGTYSTVAADTTTASGVSATPDQVLRSLLVGGDFFLGASVASCLTKLVQRLNQVAPGPSANQLSTRAMLVMCGIIRLGHSGVPPHPIDQDSLARISTCMRVLSDPAISMSKVWLDQCQEAFHHKLVVADQPTRAAEKAPEAPVMKQADELLDIRFLAQPNAVAGDSEDTSNSEVWLNAKCATEEFSARLNRITQLTGFSDPVYAEAVVTVHEYDVVLDMLIINQTETDLQNLTLELSTVGDLKLCERPQSLTIPAHQSHTIKANIKVSSTETGIIFGSVVWDTKGGDQGSVILNDIHMDIMDYIHPATCSELAFRSMWAEFEWENKVAVNTTMMDEHQFLEHICQATNMQCLTPPLAREGSCGFLAANLYAKSLFGEDALVNLSVERHESGRVGGYVRIRSKTQGIALSLGDKITMKQNTKAQAAA